MNNKFKTNIFLFESARPIINHSPKVFCCLSAFCVIPRSSFIIIWVFSSALRHCFVLIICLTCRGINIPIKLCGFLARDVAWLLAGFVHRFRFFPFPAGFPQMSSPLPRYWVNMQVVCMFRVARDMH